MVREERSDEAISIIAHCPILNCTNAVMETAALRSQIIVALVADRGLSHFCCHRYPQHFKCLWLVLKGDFADSNELTVPFV